MLRLLEAVDDLGALTYADSLAELLALNRELRRIEMLLAQLDTSAIEALDVQIEDALRAVAKAREDLGEAHRHWPEFDLAQRLQYAEEEAKSSQARAGGADNLEARLKKSEHELIGTIQVHNQKC